MLAEPKDLVSLLRCPRSGSVLEIGADGNARSADGKADYLSFDGQLILVDYDRSILDPETTHRSGGASVIQRPRHSGPAGMVKRLLSPPKQSTANNIGQFVEAVKKRVAKPLVLVIGGGTIGQGLHTLYEDPDIAVVGFDIYRSGITHFVADAHAIPTCAEAFDAVVIQAVLEHVLEPQKVVDEIWRVLKPDGVVYAETPFLQHVHEGAYDFTRFTESGHRYLFRRFALIKSGASGGAGTQMLWSIDYFFRSLFRSRAAGKAAKLAFFWVRWADRVIPGNFASDAASGVFFLGTKSDTAISPRDIVAFYAGAQR